MGTIYSVSCLDCKVTRDLDKFYAMRSIKTREDAQALSKEIQLPVYAFRAGLLASFMWEHKGHNCTVFNEHDDCAQDYDPYYGKFKEDADFWTSEKIEDE